MPLDPTRPRRQTIDDTSRLIADTQRVQASQAVEQERAAAKAQQEQEAAAKAAEKERVAAENSQRLDRYNTEGRAHYIDPATKLVVPKQSDAEYQSQQDALSQNMQDYAQWQKEKRPTFIDKVTGQRRPVHSDQEWAPIAAKAKEDEAIKARQDSVGAELKALDANTAYAEATGHKPLNETAKQQHLKDLASTSRDAVTALLPQLDRQSQAVTGGNDWIPFNEAPAPEAQAAKTRADELRQKLFNTASDSPVDLNDAELDDLQKVNPTLHQRLTSTRDLLAKDTQNATLAQTAAQKRAELLLKRDDPARYQELQRQKILADPAGEIAQRTPDLQARLDQHQAEIAKFSEHQSQYRARLDQLQAANDEAVRKGLAADDLITAPDQDGTPVPWSRKVYAQFQQAQEQARLFESDSTPQREALAESARSLQEDAKLLNEAHQLASQTRKQAREADLKKLEATGQGDLAQNYRTLDAEAEARLADLHEMYPDGPPPEAMQALQADLAARSDSLDQARTARLQAGADLYRQLTTANPGHDWAADKDPSTTAYIAGQAQQLGLTPEEARKALEYHRAADWTKPLPGEARTADFRAVPFVRDFWQSLSGSASNVPTEGYRLLPDGTVTLNPALALDRKAWNDTLAQADAKHPQTAATKAALEQQRQRMVLDAGARAWPLLSSTSDYQDFVAAHSKAEPGFKGLTVDQQAARYLEEAKGKQWFLDKLASTVGQSIVNGLVGIGNTALGLASMATGNEWIGQQMQAAETYRQFSSQQQQATGIQDSMLLRGAGMLTDTTVQLAPSMLGGAVGQIAGRVVNAFTKAETAGAYLLNLQKASSTGALIGGSVAGGAQTAQQVYTDAYQKTLDGGGTAEQARRQALLPAAYAGFGTALLAGLQGLQGVASIFRQEVGDTLANRLAKDTLPALAKLKKQGLSALGDKAVRTALIDTTKALAGHAAREGWSEAINESLDQIQQSIVQKATYDPAKKPGEILAEALQAGFLGGITGGGVGAIHGGIEVGQDAKPAAAPVHQRPETLATADTAIQNFTRPGLEPAQIEQTKLVASSVLAIAQGNADLLQDNELAAIGLERKGDKLAALPQSADGSPPRVKIDAQGNPIITQTTLDNLEKQMPAVRAAIGMNEQEATDYFAAEAQPVKPGQTSGAIPGTPAPGLSAETGKSTAPPASGQVTTAGTTPAGGAVSTPPAATPSLAQQVRDKTLSQVDAARQIIARTPQATAEAHAASLQAELSLNDKQARTLLETLGISAAPAAPAASQPALPTAGPTPTTVASLLDNPDYVEGQRQALSTVRPNQRRALKTLFADLDQHLTRYAHVFPGGIVVHSGPPGTRTLAGGAGLSIDVDTRALNLDLGTIGRVFSNPDPKINLRDLRTAFQEEMVHSAQLDLRKRHPEHNEKALASKWTRLPDDIRTRVWKSYHAYDIQQGLQPAEPPASLSTALQANMWDEFGRMLVQDETFQSVTEQTLTDNPALRKDLISYLRNLIAELTRLIKRAPREMQHEITEYKARVVKTLQGLLKQAPSATAAASTLAKQAAQTANLAQAGGGRSVVDIPADTRADIPNATPKPLPGTTGRETTAYTDNNDAIATRWHAVEVDALVISNDDAGKINPDYPALLQPRDRTSAGSESQVQDIATNANLDRLSHSPSVGDGAPIVSPQDSVVESGNGRLMGLRRAYARALPSAATYRDALIRRADEFGLDRTALQAMKHPVLVRQRTTDVDRSAFVLAANVSTIAPKREVEVAKTDAAQITPDLFASFTTDDNGDFLNAQNHDFIRSFVRDIVPPAERPGIIDSKGSLSQTGQRRIRNALFVYAYGSSPEALNTLANLTEATDPRGRNLTNAVVAAAPTFAEQIAREKAGALYPLSITDDIVAALQSWLDARTAGTTIADYLAQDRLPGIDNGPTELQSRILETLDANASAPRRLLDIFTRYARAVDHAGDPRQAALFAEEKPAKPVLWRLASDLTPALSTASRPEPTAKPMPAAQALRTYRNLGTLMDKGLKLTPGQSTALANARTRLNNLFQLDPPNTLATTSRPDPRIVATAERLGRPLEVDPAWGLPRFTFPGNNVTPTASIQDGRFVLQAGPVALAPEIVLDDEGNRGRNPLLDFLPANRLLPRQAIHTAIIQLYEKRARATRTGQGEALLIGGGPAAGKSTFIREAEAKGEIPGPSQILTLTADDIKLLIPEMQSLMANEDPRAAGIVHVESQYIYSAVVDQLLSSPDKYRLIFDATLSRPGEVIPLLQRLQSLGYQRHLRGLLIDPWEAVVRSAERGLRTRRLVAVPGVVSGHKGFQASFQQYFPHVNSHEIRGIMFGDQTYVEGGQNLRQIVVASSMNPVDPEAGQQYSKAYERGQLNERATSRAELLASYDAGHPALRTERNAGPARSQPANDGQREEGLRPTGERSPGQSSEQDPSTLAATARPDAGSQLDLFDLLTPAQQQSKLSQPDLFGGTAYAQRPAPARTPANRPGRPRQESAAPAQRSPGLGELFAQPAAPAGTGPQPSGQPGSQRSSGTGQRGTDNDLFNAGPADTGSGAASGVRSPNPAPAGQRTGAQPRANDELQRSVVIERPAAGSPARNFQPPADLATLATPSRPEAGQPDFEALYSQHGQPDPFTGARSFLPSSRITRQQGQIIGQIHAERLRRGLREGAETGDAGPALAASRSRAFAVPLISRDQLASLQQLEKIGEGTEAIVYADRERGTVYKVLTGHENFPYLGIYPQVFYSTDKGGQLDYIFAPATRPRHLGVRLAVQSLLGGTPTEIVGVGPNGHLILKQPLSPNPELGTQDETAQGTQLSKARNRAGLVRIPPRLLSDPDAPPTWLAVVEGHPFLVLDLHNDNFVGDNQTDARINDAVVVQIPPQIIAKVPRLVPVIQQATARAIQTGDRSNRMFAAARPGLYEQMDLFASPAPAQAPAVAPVDSKALETARPSLDDLAHTAATSPLNALPEPTHAQKKAGNYAHGHLSIGPLNISIENPAGSVRKGTDKNGKNWETLMRLHYGYVKGSQGADGDHIDVFVAPGTPPNYNGPVWVINQASSNGEFDEHKAIIAPDATSPPAVLGTYLSNYSAGWKGAQSMGRFRTVTDFSNWATSATHRRAPAKGNLPAVLTVTQGLQTAATRFLAKTLNTPPRPLASAGNAAAKTAETMLKIGARLTESTGLRIPLATLGSGRLDRLASDALNRVAAPRIRTAVSAAEAWLNQPEGISSSVKGVVDQLLPNALKSREWLALKHEMDRKSAWGAEVANDLIRALSNKPRFSDLAYPPEFAENPMYRVELFDAMENRIPMESLPPAMQKIGKRLRELLRTTGQELVKQGIMNQDTFDELQSNGWMPRYTLDEAEASAGTFLASFKLGIKDLMQQRSTAYHVVDTTRRDKTGQYVTVNRDEGGKRNRWRFRDGLARDTFYSDFIREQALTMLKQGGAAVENLMAPLDWQQRKEIREEIKALDRQRMNSPNEMSAALSGMVKTAIEQQKARFMKVDPFDPPKLIKDPVYAVARYVLGQTHNAATMELLHATSSRPDWVSDVDIAGFTAIPNNVRFGPLAGKFVKEDIARDVLDLIDVPNAALQLYDSLLRKWKSGKLVLNPGSHVRDAIGNSVFAFLGRNSPWNPANWKHYARAITALRDGGADYKELIEYQVLGGDAYTAAVRESLRGMLPDARTAENFNPGKFTRLLFAFGDKMHGTYEFLSQIRRVPDDFYKTAAYLNYKDRGMTPAAAAAEVRKWFPYYDRLGNSATTKAIGRFVNPFFSFFRESTRILAIAAAERPLALSAGLALPAAITALSAIIQGLDDDDLDQVKKDLKGKGKLFATDTSLFSMLLPWRSAQGQLQQFDISAIMPFADLLGTRVDTSGDAEDPWSRFWRGVISGGPFLTLLDSWRHNEDSFTRRPIAEFGMTAGERIAAYSKHAAGVLLPPLFPGGSAFDTLAKAGQRSSSRSFATYDPTQAVLRAGVGLNVSNATPNLGRLAEEWRASNNLPSTAGMDYSGTTPQSRARKALFTLLAQDEPNLPAMKETLSRLETLGIPIRTNKDIQQILFYRDPLMRIDGRSNQQRFRAGLTGLARETLEADLENFKAIKARAPLIIAQAKALP